MIKWIKKISRNLSVLRTLLAREKHLLQVKEQERAGNYLTFESVKLSETQVGYCSYIADNSIIHNCTIGKFTSIGPNVVVGYGEHPVSFLSTSPAFYYSGNMFNKDFYSPNSFNGKSQVIIGNDVWIGASVYIKNGISIGDGAVIGAGSIVTKSIPAYAVAVGTPAKVIKHRFSEAEIEKLLKIKWWDWPPEKISKYKKYFVQENLSEFFKEYDKQS